ncbi:MAG TPA: glycoside hydrolase family 15 protein [Streptosporangiaceae bacterium]|nr:glycoside hydrolase family 15 protein [Streptosporangiaceae bacterium]
MTAGPAPVPGTQAAQSWTSGAKDLVMTALGTSRVWATMTRGIFTEIYWPAVDQPQVKDFGFLVAAPGWWREVKRVDRYTLSTPEAGLMLPTVVHTSSSQAYRLTLRPVVDPGHDALLVDYELTGAEARLYPLLAPHLGTSQITPESQWGTLGADNTAWAGEDMALFASDGARFLCLLAQPGFTRAGAGYVGDTDGWTDFSRHGTMTLTYGEAGPGVVALTAELAAGSGQLALGFGDSEVAARAAAQASLDAGYDATAAAFTQGWRAWMAGLTLPSLTGPQLPAAPPGLGDALRESAVVLRSHADHTVDGAYVAGLAIPWGDYANDPGGYHMVWCRDGGETALALAAAGHADDAASVLGYLAGRQNLDGSWPRCFYVSRVPAAFDPQAAVQLDEVAFPLLLAGKLAELGVPLPDGTDNAIIKAAGYLARNGPVSGQDVDRWEENPGASPFTIGLEVVAMLVAATRLTGPDQALARALADNWNERLEEFTYVSGDEVDQAFGTDGHYVRIGLPGGGRVALANQPPGTRPVDAAALVGLEFGYLPRLGLRDPADKRITDTLAIVEAMLAADTPNGRAYHRYDVDGYGEWLDGTGWPVRKFGIGRPWPLLAGERGHLDLMSGGDASVQLRAMLAMRGRGGLLPEQVWDSGQLPWQDLRPGQPTGSAMPLAWAHSELVKLAVAVASGRPVERLALVADRYHATVPASPSWFWRDASPVVALPAGRSLVVAGPGPFTLHYGFNDWNPVTISERDAQPLGLGLFGVTLTPADLAGQASLQFVRRYPDGRWESASRHDVTLGAPGPATLRLSGAHLSRLAAAAGIANGNR